MNRNSILLIGSFSLDMRDNGGQPVKSRELYYALKDKYGSDNVHVLETPNWKKHPIKLLISYFILAAKHDVLIMLPSHNGVLVFSRLLLLSKKTRKKRIFYSVIGGWLHEAIQNNPRLKTVLRHFDGIWVETTSMLESLNKEGLNNIKVVPNFKKLRILDETEINRDFFEPYPICTFSRVVKQKGIEDAINAVIEINRKRLKIVCKLDIYGSIYSGYEEEFERIMKDVPEYIQYKGMIPPNQSVDVLKNYFLLLFPTHYFTEGVPGTLIDAYSAGVPVITSLWKNYKDVFEENITGFGYEFNDSRGLVNALEKALDTPVSVLKMRETSLAYSKKFSPEIVVKQICRYLD